MKEERTSPVKRATRVGKREDRGFASRGGWPAAFAVARWAWRLFRKEWRQQALVLTLVTASVAATVFGLLLATNATAVTDARFGTADYLITLPGADPNLDDHLSQIESRYGQIEVIRHESISLPGAVTGVDVRAQPVDGAFGAEALSLTGGRYPSAIGEIAVTDAVRSDFSLTLGQQWVTDNGNWTVVGWIENPLNLLDEFALVVPQASTHPSTVTVLAAASEGSHPGGLGIEGSNFELRPLGRAASAVTGVFVLAALGLLFVGLMTVASFAVLAQRRLRALGLLGAMGATHGNLRLAFVANGAIVGLVSAGVGAGSALATWMVMASALESAFQHRIDRLHVPWAAVAGVMALAVAMSVLGSWWPARAAARTPVIQALASRPSPPTGAHRLALPGAICFAAGPAVIVAAGDNRPALTALGVVLTAAGVLFVAPLGPGLLARASGRAHVAIRIALRDLARYRGRSGAAAAAVSLSVGIALGIVVELSAAQQAADSSLNAGNLPENQIAVWLSPQGRVAPIPDVNADQEEAATDAVDVLATSLDARRTVALEAAVSTDPALNGVPVGVGGRSAADHDPAQMGLPIRVGSDGEGGTMYRGSDAVSLYVATPTLLEFLGLAASDIDPESDLVTSQTGLEDYDLIPFGRERWEPTIQLADLPTQTSAPTTVLTDRAMAELDLVAVPTGWIIELDHPVTEAERAQARTAARSAGLSAETRPFASDLDKLRLKVMAGGLALAIAVLAMTTGLIRSETSADLATLAATGADGRVRRSLTAATASALAVIGGILGAAGAYTALIAWHRHDLSVLLPVPWVGLMLALVGLPCVAWVVGWTVAGREPDAMSRRRLE